MLLGRLGNNPAYPTVAFYGHYDVQVSGFDGQCSRGVSEVLLGQLGNNPAYPTVPCMGTTTCR